MNHIHVVVYLLDVERFLAYPTHMCAAVYTSNVVATSILFDTGTTPWACADVVFLFPSHKRQISGLVVAVLFACKALVILDMTMSADPSQTRRTAYNHSRFTRTVDQLAVGRWTITILGGALMNVCQKGGVEEPCLVCRREYVTDSSK